MSLNAIATSAFGRRAVTRAQIEAQLAVTQARAQGAAQGQGPGAVHKWTMLRTLSEIREGLGVSDRALGVLSALMSFHPETALTLPRDSEGVQGAPGGSFASLVVFPSNKALSLRANGMSEPTLRRHLAALVEAGLIIRRDSPNGKRYARRDGEDVAQAFGFDLSPLVARAPEFDARLDAVQAESRRLRLLRERVSLLRRDLAKRIAFALDEGLHGPWNDLRQAFLRLSGPLRRTRGADAFAALAADLDDLADQVAASLTQAMTGPSRQTKNSNGDADHFERRHTESNSNQIKDFEPVFQEAEGEGSRGGASGDDATATQTRDLPLPLVLEACPDIADYRLSGERIGSWREFVDTAAAVRPMLGVSPDAWRDAVETLGEKAAAVAVAFILQRSEYSSEANRTTGAPGRGVIVVNGSPAIRSPGGYLRALTQKGRDGSLPLWPAVLAHLAQRGKRRSRTGAG